MKKFVAVLAMVGCAVMFAASAFAFEASADVYASVVDTYIWRGVEQNGGETALQSGMDVGVGGLTISYWTNLDLEGVNSDEVTETDIVLDYTFSPTELLSVSVGEIYYAFGPSVGSTHELYLGLGVDTLLSPSLTVYYDYDLASTDNLDGLYYSLAIGHDIDLAEGLSLSLGAALNYCQESPLVYNFADGGAVFDDFSTTDFSIAASYAVTDQISIDASYTYYMAMGGDADDIGLMDDESYGSLGATFAF